jgi:integral membrane sensor domain MASE1
MSKLIGATRPKLITWRASEKAIAWAAKLIAFALLYVVVAKIGLSLAFTAEQVTAVWPPTGLALAILVVFGYRYAPAIFAGAFLANFLTKVSFLGSAGIAAGNTIEALVGSFILINVYKITPGLKKPRDVIALMAAAAVGSVASATIGTISLLGSGIVNRTDFLAIWRVWWIGDVMGALIFGPVFLLAFTRIGLKILYEKRIQASLMLAMCYALSMAAFTQSQTQYSILLPYIIFPIVVWAAMRFLQPGVALAILIIATTAIWATAQRLGPFVVSSSMDQNLIAVHLFLLVFILTGLLLASSFTERQLAQEQLQHQAKELEKAKKELSEANDRITKLLADLLEDKGSRRRHDA